MEFRCPAFRARARRSRRSGVRLCHGPGDRVWLARLGAVEAYRWDGAGLKLELRIDARHGFPALEPSGLTLDAAGLVWLTSVRGLIRVDPEAASVRVYGVRDGLPGQEFEDAPVARPGDGRILAGSTDGLVLFDPAAVRPADQAPQLIVEAIDVRRGDERAAFTPGQAFSISHDDRDLRIVARLLSFNDAHNHAYRFRLSGYDRDWVDVGSAGERTFSQLRPGQYRLEVKARAADNVWSRAQSIEFSVSPPWWQTWWAIAGFAGLGVLLLWTLADTYRLRLKRRHAWQLAEQKRKLAEHASLAKTQFLATLGHEVRTPMTGVLGMSELLLGTPLDAQQRGYAESIHNAGEHLLRLVNDALDLARIESGRLELTDVAFDLRALVDEAGALMAPLAQRKGLAFATQIAPDAPQGLRGDAIRIRQILLNLLGNAIKFTERGRVCLRVSALTPQGVRFDIIDTGPGLNEEQQARLFRRFEQAEGALTSARYGGSGLGLAICQELAEAMSGQVTVDSRPGQGACFSVSLPLAEAEIQAGDIAPTAATLVSIRTLSLLLVEDDPTVADVIAGLLRAQGHRVTHAGMRWLGWRKRRRCLSMRRCWTSTCPAWMASRWRGIAGAGLRPPSGRADRAGRRGGGAGGAGGRVGPFPAQAGDWRAAERKDGKRGHLTRRDLIRRRKVQPRRPARRDRCHSGWAPRRPVHRFRHTRERPGCGG